MEITVNKKAVVVLIIAVVLAALVVGAIALWLALNSAGKPILLTVTPALRTESSSLAKPESVSVAFATAFYAVDYREQGAWLDNLKLLMTDDGYKLIEASFLPVLWPQLESAQTITLAGQVMVEDTGLAVEGVSPIGGPYQVRNVDVNIAPEALWPTMQASLFSANLLIAHEGDLWRVAMFMDDAQVEQLKKQETDPQQ
jgi:hypothetical protein